MVSNCGFSVRTAPRNVMPFILAICWLLGLLFGVICYAFSGPDTVSLMRGVVFCPVSIVGLLNAVLIPFLLSVLFVALSVPKMLLVICFVKAFSFSFVSLGILMSTDCGGWFVRYFLQFSDCIMIPLFYWYWSNFVLPFTVPHQSVTGIACCVLVLAVFLDYRVVAPYLCA